MAVVMKNVFGISVFICSGCLLLPQMSAVTDRGYRTVAASLCDVWSRPTGPPLRLHLHFLPNAAFLLPVVERFAVDLVNGRFRNGQLPGLYHHEEINIVNFAVGAFHVDTRKIFVSAKTRKPVIVDSDQVQRQIFALIWHVKLLVGRFRSVAADESLKSVRNV